MGNEKFFEDILTAIEGYEVEHVEGMFLNATHKTQVERKAQLRAAFRERGVALVLGAGVSRGSGVPLWSELVSRLVLAVVSTRLEPGAPIADVYLPFSRTLEACLPADALVSASYVRRRLRLRARTGLPESDDAPFLAALRTALYQTATHPSALHDALASLVKNPRGGCGVRQVLTYNFDDLFESALDAAGCAFEVIEKKERPTGRGVPVLHPHGILARSPRAGVKDWVVFAEEHYHDEFASPHSWSNVVQLNAFSQLRCVFVGLSMVDPNIRRLLGATRAEAPQHFAFLKRRSVVDTFYGTNDDGSPVSDPRWATPQLLRSQGYRWSAAGHPGDDAREELARRLTAACAGGDAAIDETLHGLGVQVIWYDRHDELPGLLESVANDPTA